jgi:uncharacterized protein YbbC (DUF1343 family)
MHAEVQGAGQKKQTNSAALKTIRDHTGHDRFLLGIQAFTPVDLYRAAGKTSEKVRLVLGLITNQTGKNEFGRRTIDVLKKKNFDVRRIFAPEHGISGTVRAAHDVHDSVDPTTGIPIISLFGNGAGKLLDASQVRDLDALVFDMQDSGMRHYTYISTLFLVLQAAAENNKPLIVFDRPNPLKHPMEGPLVDPELYSFVSIAAIPLRHGMTIGELARYFNTHILEKQAKLTVVPMKNYNRLQGMPGQLLAPLSPYIKNKKSCYGYSFLGLLGEVKPFDVGLGTEYAMRCIALPEKVHVSKTFWPELANRLKKIGLHTSFLSYYSTRKKQQCTGLLCALSDPARFSSCQVLLTVLSYTYKTSVPLQFSALFDKAAGTSKLRACVQGDISRASFAKTVNEQLREFYESAKSSFLYSPAPKLVFLSEKD